MLGHFPFKLNWHRPQKGPHQTAQHSDHGASEIEAGAVATATEQGRPPIIDRVCMIFSVLMPMTALPQIHLIYTSHNVSGVSLLMWIFDGLGVIPFLIFGIVHKERQLIILNGLWLTMQGIIIAGILMYR